MTDDDSEETNEKNSFNSFPWNAMVRGLTSRGYLKKHPDRMLFLERDKDRSVYVAEIVGHGTWGEKMRKSKLEDLETFDPGLYEFCIGTIAEGYFD